MTQEEWVNTKAPPFSFVLSFFLTVSPSHFPLLPLSGEMITGSVVRWASASTRIIFLWEGLRRSRCLSADWLLHLTRNKEEGGLWEHRDSNKHPRFSAGSVCWTSLLVTTHHYQHTLARTRMHTHMNKYAHTHTHTPRIHPPCLFSWEKESKKQDRGALHRFAAIVCQSFCACVCE